MSNTIILTTIPVAVVEVSIFASANPVCSGSLVTFTAIPVNGGENPIYQWKVNDVNVGTNIPVYIFIPINGQEITCTLTSSLPLSTGTAISNPFTMTVYPIVTSSVKISTSRITVCTGSKLTFTAIPTNGGDNPIYQWKVNGRDVGINSPTFTYISLNNDKVSCVMTPTDICPRFPTALSNIIGIAVRPPTLSISPKQKSIFRIAGYFNLAINSNCTYTLSSDVGWLTVESSGVGNKNIKVYYTANETGINRAGIISVNGAIGKLMCIITQTK